MKTKKPYVLVGDFEKSHMLVRALERQNIECIVDEQHAGETLDFKTMLPLPIIGVEESLKFANTHIFVNMESAEVGNMLKDIATTVMSEKEAFIDYFSQEAEVYDSLNKRENFRFSNETVLLCINDKGVPAGNAYDSYFWQDIWGAQHVYERRPQLHYDIGSRIDGFIAHLLSFNQKVCLLDIRPLPIEIPGVSFIECDATKMANIEEDSIESLSALCSLEHFGLGRYGDPIDPEACFTCFTEIEKRMKKGGRFYMAVPIGKEHLEFNAHRVFYASTIVNSFPNMKLIEYSVTYDGKIEKDIPVNKYDNHSVPGYYTGLFAFEKM